MKIRLFLFTICFLISSSIFAQKDYSPIVIYWKTLTPIEKEIYLFSYLTQVYDTHTSLIKDRGKGEELTMWYFNNRAEKAYNILELLKTVDTSKFIEWIDEYYRHEEYRDQPFYEALNYAYLHSQVKGQTLLEKYESLFGGEEEK